MTARFFDFKVGIRELSFPSVHSWVSTRW